MHTPAGLRLGGTTPAEIALGVLAELVQVRASTATSASGAQHHHEHGEHQEHTEHDAHAGRTHSASSGPVMATDPVCGMTVVAADPTAHTDHDTVTVWFCSDGCKAAFLKDPGRYVTA